TLALIPEVISFSVIAGVDPKVSLIASVVLAISMTFLGGRPAMITAAAGAVALVVAPLVHTHGVQYLLPTVILAGLIQIAFGVLGLARIMRFIPDRKSTRLNSSHVSISYAVFCLKKKNKKKHDS